MAKAASRPRAERKPDAEYRVKVGRHEVQVYSFGSGDEVLFCLNGGPGLPCDYVRDSHSILADHGYRVVVHDRLGIGPSSKVIDVGCGAGRHAFEAFRRGADVVAFDRDASELRSVDTILRAMAEAGEAPAAASAKACWAS